MATKRTISAEHALSDGADDRLLICITRAAYRILRTIASNDLLWASTYYEVVDGDFLAVGDADFNEIDRHISDFLGGDVMAVCDLKEAIEAIVAAVEAIQAQGATASGGCGCGTSGAGSRPIYDGPPVSLDEGEFPPGFDDFGHFTQYKCNVAHAIVDEIKADYAWLDSNLVTGLGVFLTASALIPALLTPVPYDDLLALTGLLVALGGISLETVVNEIDLNFDLYVCALVNAKDTGEAKSAFMEQLEQANLNILAEKSMLFFLSTANLSRLFDDTYDKSLVDKSCGCICGPYYVSPAYGETVVGYTDSGGEAVLSLVSHQYTPTYHETGVRVNSQGGDNCGPIGKLMGIDVGGAVTRYILYGDADNKFYDSPTPPAFPVENVRSVQLQSTSSFTVDVRWEDMPPI